MSTQLRSAVSLLRGWDPPDTQEVWLLLMALIVCWSGMHLQDVKMNLRDHPL